MCEPVPGSRNRKRKPRPRCANQITPIVTGKYSEARLRHVYRLKLRVVPAIADLKHVLHVRKGWQEHVHRDGPGHCCSRGPGQDAQIVKRQLLRVATIEVQRRGRVAVPIRHITKRRRVDAKVRREAVRAVKGGAEHRVRRAGEDVGPTGRGVRRGCERMQTLGAWSASAIAGEEVCGASGGSSAQRSGGERKEQQRRKATSTATAATSGGTHAVHWPRALSQKHGTDRRQSPVMQKLFGWPGREGLKREFSRGLLPAPESSLYEESAVIIATVPLTAPTRNKRWHPSSSHLAS